MRWFLSEAALLDLSSHVRILFLGKLPEGGFGNLFNIHPSEWERIVLEMFSRRIDTLFLYKILKDDFISASNRASLLKLLKVRSGENVRTREPD